MLYDFYRKLLIIFCVFLFPQIPSIFFFENSYSVHYKQGSYQKRKISSFHPENMTKHLDQVLNYKNCHNLGALVNSDWRNVHSKLRPIIKDHLDKKIDTAFIESRKTIIENYQFYESLTAKKGLQTEDINYTKSCKKFRKQLLTHMQTWNEPKKDQLIFNMSGYISRIILAAIKESTFDQEIIDQTIINKICAYMNEECNAQNVIKSVISDTITNYFVRFENVDDSYFAVNMIFYDFDQTDENCLTGVEHLFNLLKMSRNKTQYTNMSYAIDEDTFHIKDSLPAYPVEIDQNHNIIPLTEEQTNSKKKAEDRLSKSFQVIKSLSEKNNSSEVFKIIPKIISYKIEDKTEEQKIEKIQGTTAVKEDKAEKEKQETIEIKKETETTEVKKDKEITAVKEDKAEKEKQETIEIKKETKDDKEQVSTVNNIDDEMHKIRFYQMQIDHFTSVDKMMQNLNSLISKKNTLYYSNLVQDKKKIDIWGNVGYLTQWSREQKDGEEFGSWIITLGTVGKVIDLYLGGTLSYFNVKYTNLKNLNTVSGLDSYTSHNIAVSNNMMYEIYKNLYIKNNVIATYSMIASNAIVKIDHSQPKLNQKEKVDQYSAINVFDQFTAMYRFQFLPNDSFFSNSAFISSGFEGLTIPYFCKKDDQAQKDYKKMNTYKLSCIGEVGLEQKFQLNKDVKIYVLEEFALNYSLINSHSQNHQFLQGILKNIDQQFIFDRKLKRNDLNLGVKFEIGGEIFNIVQSKLSLGLNEISFTKFMPILTTDFEVNFLL